MTRTGFVAASVGCLVLSVWANAIYVSLKNNPDTLAARGIAGVVSWLAMILTVLGAMAASRRREQPSLTVVCGTVAALLALLLAGRIG